MGGGSNVQGPELLPVVLTFVGFVLFPGAIIGWIFFGGRRQRLRLEARVAELTPHAELAEAAVRSGGVVELRTSSVAGAQKVWLECDVASATHDWSAAVSVVHRAWPPGSGYREPSGDADAIREMPFTVGEDGEGVSTLGPVAARRTGALVLPRGGKRHWIQLVALPDAPPGSDLFVSVTLGEVKNAQHATFRVFLGLSLA